MRRRRDYLAEARPLLKRVPVETTRIFLPGLMLEKHKAIIIHLFYIKDRYMKALNTLCLRIRYYNDALGQHVAKHVTMKAVNIMLLSIGVVLLGSGYDVAMVL